MKYKILWTMFLFIISSSAQADYLDDVRNFGYISGTGIACGARGYKSYETLARAYLVSAAQSDQEQAEGMYEYNTAKAEAYLRQRHSGLFACEDINERFNSQKIFQAKLYKNGTIKMPDGKIIRPRQEYDATLLYDRTKDEREILNTYYETIREKRRAQAQREGIYEKIREAESKIQH